MPGTIHHDRVGKATAYDAASKKYTVEYTTNAKGTESKEFAEGNGVKGLSHLVKQYLLESLNHDPVTQEKVRKELQSIATNLNLHWDKRLELKDNLVPNKEGNLVVNHTLVNEAINTKIKEVFDAFKTFHQSIGGTAGDAWVKECEERIDTFFANAIIRLYGWKKELGDQLTLEELTQKAKAIDSNFCYVKYRRQSINLTPALQKVYNELTEDLANPKKPKQHIERRAAILKFLADSKPTPKSLIDILTHVRKIVNFSDTRSGQVKKDLEALAESKKGKEPKIVSVDVAGTGDKSWVPQEPKAEYDASSAKKGKKPKTAASTAAAAAAAAVTAAEVAMQSQLVDNGAATSPVTAGRPPSPSLGGGGGGGGAKRVVGENAESPSGKKAKCDGVKQDAAFPAAAAAASPPSSYQQTSGSSAAQEVVVSEGSEKVAPQRSIARTVAAAPNTAAAAAAAANSQPHSIDTGGAAAKKAKTSAAEDPIAVSTVLKAKVKNVGGKGQITVKWDITTKMDNWKSGNKKNRYVVKIESVDKSEMSHPLAKTTASFWTFTGLTLGKKYRAQLRLGDTNNVSRWSATWGPLKCDRQAVSTACRREMWKRTYVSTSNSAGLASQAPCLGCLALGRPEDKISMLSSTLENVQAGHIIPCAKGAPDCSDADAAYAWNLFPLCKLCNEKEMGTDHLIDWFYTECTNAKTSTVFVDLLDRLERAASKDYPHLAEKPYPHGWDASPTTCMKVIYKEGSEACVGHATDSAPDEPGGKFQKWNKAKSKGGREAGFTTKDDAIAQLYQKGLILKTAKSLPTVQKVDGMVQTFEDCSKLLQKAGRIQKEGAWAAAKDAVTKMKDDLTTTTLG